MSNNPFPSGPDNPNFNGGLSFTQGRTIIVHRDGGWTYYARALMIAHLGRKLAEDEVVHHINGDRSDDRIENLQVVTRAEHLAIHRPELVAARVAAKTHCIRGHEFTPDNTRVDKTGRRFCRACARWRYYQRKEAA